MDAAFFAVAAITGRRESRFQIAATGDRRHTRAL